MISSAHGPAAALQQSLATLLLALGLMVLWLLIMDLRHAVEVHTQWPKIPARVESSADEGWLELELREEFLSRLGPLRQPAGFHPREPDHTRVLAPARPYSGINNLDAIELAIDPAAPGRIEVVDWQADLWPMLAKLVWCLLTLAAAYAVWKRLRWGQDLTWHEGLWIPTASASLRPGMTAAETTTIREHRDSYKGAKFWGGAITLLVLWAVPWAVIEHRESPIESGSVALVSLGLLGLVLVAAASMFTRRIRHDGAGIADASWFGVKRVPWSAIAQWRQVNTNEAAQQRYDRTSKRSGSRPPTILMWIAGDAAGHELLRMNLKMAPEDTFAALCARIAGRSAPDDSHDNDDDTEIEPALQRQLYEQQRRSDRSMRIGLAVVLLPFVLMAGWSIFNALWFSVAAERVPGTVSARSNGELVSLTVSYVAVDGKTRQIESDGTRGNAQIASGATITVLVDPENPDNAVLDQFLELWLMPMILSGLLLLVAIPFGIAIRALRPGIPPPQETDTVPPDPGK